MGVDYGGSMFYGVELGVDADGFYEMEEDFDYSGPVGIGFFGDSMSGTTHPAAYLKDTFRDLDQYGEFGLWSLNNLDVPEGAHEALQVALQGIPLKGEPGWFVSNDVS